MESKRTKDNTSSRLVTAWGECCSGPGWTNNLIWRLWQDSDGTLSIDSVQQEDVPPHIADVIKVSAAVGDILVKGVKDVKHDH